VGQLVRSRRPGQDQLEVRVRPARGRAPAQPDGVLSPDRCYGCSVRGVLGGGTWLARGPGSSVLSGGRRGWQLEAETRRLLGEPGPWEPVASDPSLGLGSSAGRAGEGVLLGLLEEVVQTASGVLKRETDPTPFDPSALGEAALGAGLSRLPGGCEEVRDLLWSWRPRERVTDRGSGGGGQGEVSSAARRRLSGRLGQVGGEVTREFGTDRVAEPARMGAPRRGGQLRPGRSWQGSDRSLRWSAAARRGCRRSEERGP